MRFTADDAFEASQDGEPIMISSGAAARMIANHGASLEEYETESGLAMPAEIDAASVLAWLGY